VGFGLNQVRHRRKRQKTAAAEKTTMVACKFKTPNSVMTKATCRSLSHAATLHFSHKEQKIVMRNKLFKSVLFLFVSAACLLSQPYYYGVNLSSAEFGSTVPGTYGTTYIYPSVSSLDYYNNKGLRLIRLPFLWERLQQSLNAPLDSAELSRMDAFVAGISARNMLVLLDAHNYGRRAVGGTSYIIGSTQVPVSALLPTPVGYQQ